MVRFLSAPRETLTDRQTDSQTDRERERERERVSMHPPLEKAHVRVMVNPFWDWTCNVNAI
jgi:hypothetical protein